MKHLEPEFIKFHFKESLSRIRIAILVAFFFYSIFGILDLIIAPDKKNIFWFIRYAVVCPVALWVLGFSFRPNFEKYCQSSLFFMCLTGGLGIEAMVILADPPATYSYYAGIILIFITIYTFIRMRFLWAVACSWLIFICYEIGAVWFAKTPGVMLTHNNFFFVTANILCMLAGYSMELNNRKLFFSSFKLEQARDNLAKANLELDQRVKERTRELLAANTNLNKEIQERISSEKTRMQLEKELNRKQKLEAIGTLAGGIAHDFNNILAAVIGYSELTLESLDRGSDEYTNIAEVLKAGTRAADLTRQILTFSRQVEQDIKPVQLGHVVREALKLIQASVPAGINICHVIESNEFVMGDESQLHRVVINLCTNAYHAMEGTKGTLDVRVEDTVINKKNANQDSAQIADQMMPGEYVTLTICDTGCGMAPEIIGKIFDPFFTTKSVDQGTGMGLSVVHGIVKQYKGYIRVYSELGHGTKFVIFIPVFHTDNVTDPVPLDELHTGTETVMIIDDEGTLVKMMQQHLESMGYTVKGFADSVTAVEYFSEHPDEFDLVVTDFSMPGMTGLDVSEKILGMRSDIPVILCTGYGKDVSPQTIESVGISALLTKPLSRRSLSSTIRIVLDKNKNHVQPITLPQKQEL